MDKCKAIRKASERARADGLTFYVWSGDGKHYRMSCGIYTMFHTYFSCYPNGTVKEYGYKENGGRDYLGKDVTTIVLA